MTRSDPSLLAGRHVLVVEDEFYLATDLAAALAEAGAHVLGPANSLASAGRLLDESRPDCAVLDMNLRGDSTGPLAARLAAEGTPFLVLSGYDRTALPASAADAPFLEKPVDTAEVIRRLGALTRT